MVSLWLRAEASAGIGLGHLMRMVALAQAARSCGSQATFVLDRDSIAAQIPSRFGFPAVPFDRWVHRMLPGQAVVFDGYGFGPTHHRDAAERGAVVVAMDDFGSGRFDVDLLVNQNLVADLQVDVPPRARVLVGPRFALIREEFLRQRRTRATAGSRLLVSLGGTDTQRLAGTVVRAALGVNRFEEIVLLAGPGARPDVPAGIQIVVDPPSVADVFATVDVAISAAGSTTWELLCCGVPTALIQTEENQRHIAGPVALRDAAIFLGTGGDIDLDAMGRLTDPSVRRRLVRRALDMVDGLGAHRVLTQIIEISRNR